MVIDMMLFSTIDTWNKVVFSFEVIALIIAILMILVGLLQDKKAQTGLSALNGGNDELFIQGKERGLDRTLSIIMTCLSIILFTTGAIIAIFTHVYLST